MPALVTVPLSAPDPATLLADSARAKDAGADVVEWRFDTCHGIEATAFMAAIARSPLPVLVTIRHADEGGQWRGSAGERLALLQAADAAGAAYIDIELAHADSLGSWKPVKSRLILSFHDFTGIGGGVAALSGRVHAMHARDAIAKVAVTARDGADLAVVQAVLAAAAGPTIALAMGEHGLPSRLLAGVWGSFLTFARLADSAGSAPGQPTVDDLVGIYRLHEQQRDWRVLGVVGSPIGHSLSPHIHNACLAADGVAAVYVPFRVEDLAAFWDACGPWISGLSVTIPHKEALIALAARDGWTVEDGVAAVGAANTLHRPGGGTPAIANTDELAIRALLGDLHGRTVLCLGAGGVARAIASAVRAGGGRLLIANRTRARAEELAAAFHGEVVEPGPAVAYDVLINGTAQGMKDGTATPWPFPHRAGTTVFDTVYIPHPTRLLREAAAAGAHTIPGLGMFTRQAAAQYQRFTGRTMDMVRAEGVLRRRLGISGDA